MSLKNRGQEAFASIVLSILNIVKHRLHVCCKDYEDGESCAGGHQMASVLFGQVTATENKCQFEADMETHYNGSFITFDDEAALKECWLVTI